MVGSNKNKNKNYKVITDDVVNIAPISIVTYNLGLYMDSIKGVLCFLRNAQILNLILIAFLFKKIGLHQITCRKLLSFHPNILNLDVQLWKWLLKLVFNVVGPGEG